MPYSKHDQLGHLAIIVPMKTVNIGDLKARLSAHIKLVRGGEEVLVCDRDKPVARIIPCNLDKHSDQEQLLIAQGTLIPPRKSKAEVQWPDPAGNVSDEAVKEIWRQEREGR
jgi:antitoxin (DNA-binding transcriptional repressor) of toxin-antitoxin stability system